MMAQATALTSGFCFCYPGVMDEIERQAWLADGPRVTRPLEPVTVPGYALAGHQTRAYRYPADCFHILMLRPALADPEPRPIIWMIGEWFGERIICTCEPDAMATYITLPSAHDMLSQP